MIIRNIEVTVLKHATYNPRQIDKTELDKLMRSIREFGMVDPIIVNADMTVIGGHQRLKACQQLQHAEVPCVVLDIPKEKEKALNLALNRISGAWDDEKLQALLHELSEVPSLDLSLTGFDSREIDSFLEAFTTSTKDPDDIPEVLAGQPSITQRGDLYELGPHRVLCGDATIAGDTKTLLGGGTAK